ncbi:MAG: hypothetical protein NTW29_15995 [Bacteroidetes bacterium]|nr:hypothetical protein [Bacteroidota bacterium]
MRKLTPYSQLMIGIMLLLFFQGCAGQPPLSKKYSLLTWETYREGGGEVPQFKSNILVEYTFTGSGYLRNTLYETPVRYFPNFAEYPTQLYDDRYIINSMGDIFDLKDKKFIHAHIGDDYFVEKNGDSVIMRHTGYTPSSVLPSDKERHQTITTPYYFFQLSTGKIIPISSGNRYRIGNTNRDQRDYASQFTEGVLSPDKTRKVFFVPLEDPLSGNFLRNDTSLYLCGWTRVFHTRGYLEIRNADGSKQSIADSVQFEHSLRSAFNLPLTWLNDNEILTQKAGGQLIRIRLQPLQVITYPVIPNVNRCAYPPYFERTPEDSLVYVCSTQKENVFRINTFDNSITPLPATPIGYGYTQSHYDGTPPSIYGTRYQYKNVTILEDSMATEINKITREGLIAMVQREIIPTRNQYDPWWWITIYDPEQNKKQTIKVGYLKQLIGWRRKN